MVRAVAAAFSQTLRALDASRPRASLAAVALACLTVAAWVLWFTRAEVAVHALTADARVEVEARTHAVDSPIAGRILRTELELGRQAKAGEVLVEIDVQLERRQLDQLGARIAAIEPQAEATRRALVAQRRALGDDEQATLAALDEGRARSEQARLASQQAGEESARAAKLLSAGAIASSEATRLASEAAQQTAAADAALLALEKLHREQRTRGSEGLARVEALERDLALLEGQRTTTLADARVLQETIDKSLVRAPVSGRIGEIATINAGMFVHPGDRLFSIVPPGELKAVANFVPADALGRVRVGQTARLRLEGFPWMQYGTVPATVTRVGSELRDGRVRVDLAIHPDPSSGIPMQHGLPAVAEIDVEWVTPARLVLRSIGAGLGRPTRTRGAPGS
jgi:membrane fusion protein (multidrug efflux system)